MNLTAKLSDLMDALYFDSPEHVTRFDRQAARLVTVERSVLSAVEEGDEETLASLPSWQQEEVETARAIVNDCGDRFIGAPDKFDFHEYHHMERFIGTVSEERTADDLWRAIKGRGAFRHFKDTLHRLEIEEQWYRYRDEAVARFVIDWAEVHNVPFEDDTKGRGK